MRRDPLVIRSLFSVDSGMKIKFLYFSFSHIVFFELRSFESKKEEEEAVISLPRPVIFCVIDTPSSSPSS